MTQTNNEREALDVRYFNEKLRLVLEGLPNYTRSELARELQRLSNTASPISQNEQQEAVAWRYVDSRGNYRYRGYVDDFDKKHPLLKPIPLFTSPPKQAIPEGWKLVPIEPTQKMYQAAKEARVNFLEMNGVLVGELVQMIYESMLNAAPTNTEVGE